MMSVSRGENATTATDTTTQARMTFSGLRTTNRPRARNTEPPSLAGAASEQAPSTLGQPTGSLRSAWGQHAELVALGVSQHRPGDLPLTDVGRGGAAVEEPVDQGRLGGVRWAGQVEVDPVGDGLVVGDGDEHQGD